MTGRFGEHIASSPEDVGDYAIKPAFAARDLMFWPGNPIETFRAGLLLRKAHSRKS
jgi:hypothetical protein